MAYTLVGNCYIGTGSIPAPVVGYDAIDTTSGNRYSSNTSSTAWTLVGNINQVQGGSLPITGGTMTGSISGASGWAPLSAPNFTSSAKRDGINLATVNDLTDLQTSILNSITPTINSAVAGTTASISVKTKLAFGHGEMIFTGPTMPATQTIPLPYYPGNVQAAESECVWMVAPSYAYVPSGASGGSNNDWQLIFYDANGSIVDPTSTRTFRCTGSSPSAGYYPSRCTYFIIGVRP